MRARSASTTRGVKAWLTSDRRRVWSGGSRNIIRLEPTWRTGLSADALGPSAELGRVGAEPGVAQDGGAVVVAGEDPAAVGSVVDGLVLPDQR